MHIRWHRNDMQSTGGNSFTDLVMNVSYDCLEWKRTMTSRWGVRLDNKKIAQKRKWKRERRRWWWWEDVCASHMMGSRRGWRRPKSVAIITLNGGSSTCFMLCVDTSKSHWRCFTIRIEIAARPQQQTVTSLPPSHPFSPDPRIDSRSKWDEYLSRS